MKQYKLGVGPMSHEIIGAIVNYPHKDRLMVVASRNQVDYIDGYVCTSQELADNIKPAGILLCRDHCGPYFKDSDKGLSLADSITECKKTIYNDIVAGFDLIHIDTSKIDDPDFKIAEDLIEFAIANNPNIMLEFGSEENSGFGLADSLNRLIPQLEFFSQYHNARYFVTQTGSLTLNRQAGTFDVSTNKIVADTIHSYGLFFKEHNADYLQPEDITLRTEAGVDAMNIAPQLGYLQTLTAEWKCKSGPEWNAFSRVVLMGNKWQRWIDPYEWGSNKTTCVRVAGHYHYNSPEWKDVKLVLDRTTFHPLMIQILHDLFDRYVGINSATGETS